MAPLLPPTFSLAALLLAASHIAQASPDPTLPSLTNVEVDVSEGGHATCITGTVGVDITFLSDQWNLTKPNDTRAATEFFVLAASQYYINTSAYSTGVETLQETYDIWVKFCVPKNDSYNATSSDVVQLVTHGAFLDHHYWDFALGYSYVDAAARDGLATLNYDRLGSGRSDHPDPLYVLQGSAPIEVAHVLVQMLRAGKFGGISYTKIVGVGHSLGSIVTEGVMSVYPDDFDAAMITGHAYYKEAAVGVGPVTVIGSVAVSDVSRLSHLPAGYFTPGSEVGVQLGFYKYPNFDRSILGLEYSRLQTVAMGEAFMTPTSPALGNQTVLDAWAKPVMVVLGENDYVACGYSCLTPIDYVQETLKYRYPAATPEKSVAYLAPRNGHNLNTHYNAQEVFSVANAWVHQI